MSKKSLWISGISTLIFIVGAIGTGLYFGKVFDSNKFEPIKKNFIDFQNFIRGSINNNKLNFQEEEDSFSYDGNLKKVLASERNSFDINCDNGVSVAPNYKIIPNIVIDDAANFVCLVEERDEENHFSKASNFFPIFIFSDLVNDLYRVQVNELELVDTLEGKSVRIKGGKRSPNALVQAKENAKKIVRKMINLPHGPEFALLDQVLITGNRINEGLEASGIYRRVNNSHVIEYGLINNSTNDESSHYWNNKKNISLKVNKTPLSDYIAYDQNNNIVEKDLRYSASDEYNNITFDVEDLLHTFAHEYGHHVTLYNNKQDAQKFLDKLEDLFDSENNSFLDFKLIYKYFNNLNIDSEDNNIRALEKLKTSISDNEKNIIERNRDEILKLYRKKYSGDIVRLDEVLYERGQRGDVEWNILKKSLYQNIHYGILKKSNKNSVNIGNEWPLPNELREKLINAIDEGTGDIKEVEYEELRQYLINNDYYFYEIDYNQVLQFSGNKTTLPKLYYLVPKTFSTIYNLNKVGGNSPLKIFDIFGNQKIVNTNSYIDKALFKKRDACQSLPLNFATLGHYNYDSLTLTNAIKNAKLVVNNGSFRESYERITEIADNQIIKNLSYYYSVNELTARLMGLLTFNYNTKKTLGTCVYKYKVKVKDTENSYEVGLDNAKENTELYTDFSIFGAFGLNVLKQEKAKTLYQYLTNSPLIDSDNTFIPYTVRARRDKISDFENFNFHISYNRLDETDTIKQKWNGLYLLGMAKLSQSNIRNAFQTTAVYDDNLFFVKPNGYDYNNLKYYSSTSDDLSNVYKKLEEKTFYEDNDKYVGLVFNIYGIWGKSPDQDNYTIDNLVPESDIITNTFNNINLIFIDSNNNEMQDNTEVKLTIPNQ